MAWRDEADSLDREAVRAFDYGDVTFQKMNDAGAAVGDPIPVPADFSSPFLEQGGGDRVEAATRSLAIAVHRGDFPDGVWVAAGDRFILATGNAAGTYVIDTVEDNEDRTGAMVRLRKTTLR